MLILLIYPSSKFKFVRFDFSDYVLKPNTTLNINNDIYPHSEAGAGVIEALWKLTLAMIFKALITIFTFGMKVHFAVVFIASLFNFSTIFFILTQFQ